ncbi:hypothetical protein M413DRAFT_7401 [Hebeloma cylindrosporum]|uniref:Uncharacterized protein n=1 Tax=Hebeloma cylindrosporum TaxID=76867 RepID=A0A0C3CXC5_HEBCY|nr:hypothetical protein M413DRAFT_7401 [Hebeloma cylindrosporum h7]
MEDPRGRKQALKATRMSHGVSYLQLAASTAEPSTDRGICAIASEEDHQRFEDSSQLDVGGGDLVEPRSFGKDEVEMSKGWQRVPGRENEIRKECEYQEETRAGSESMSTAGDSEEKKSRQCSMMQMCFANRPWGSRGWFKGGRPKLPIRIPPARIQVTRMSIFPTSVNILALRQHRGYENFSQLGRGQDLEEIELVGEEAGNKSLEVQHQKEGSAKNERMGAGKLDPQVMYHRQWRHGFPTIPSPILSHHSLRPSSEESSRIENMRIPRHQTWRRSWIWGKYDVSCLRYANYPRLITISSHDIGEPNPTVVTPNAIIFINFNFHPSRNLFAIVDSVEAHQKGHGLLFKSSKHRGVEASLKLNQPNNINPYTQTLPSAMPTPLSVPTTASICALSHNLHDSSSLLFEFISTSSTSNNAVVAPGFQPVNASNIEEILCSSMLQGQDQKKMRSIGEEMGDEWLEYETVSREEMRGQAKNDVQEIQTLELTRTSPYDPLVIVSSIEPCILSSNAAISIQ